jgi:hypothetical protein
LDFAGEDERHSLESYNTFQCNSELILMEEITIKIPKGLPGSYLKKKIDDLVREEELKWALFERCRDELSLTKDDLEQLESARERAWSETRKKYGL